MATSKSLPARPSLESLRKQAKQLLRAVQAADPDAIARVRARLPDVDRPLSQRNAQLVIAREYGYAGWRDLTAEVNRRLGSGLEWAAQQAERIIHDNDVERLKLLLIEYPALLSWRADPEGRGVLGMATDAYGDAGDPQREGWFTRAACAEVLIDAGAFVAPAVCESILQSRARGLLELFHRKGLLPPVLKYFAALGDLAAVRTAVDEAGSDLAIVNEAFVRACLFNQEAVASFLLERAIALDPALGRSIDASVGRETFIKQFIETRPEIVREISGETTRVGLWQAFVSEQVRRTVLSGDLTAFVRGLRHAPWLLGDDWVDFQNDLIGVAILNGRREFIAALFDLDPAILRRQPPPPTQNIEHALVYARADLVPMLTRIWPVPDDLIHAAGMGDLSRVKHWLDTAGTPVPTQLALDTALAWAVINRHFEVADYLIEHGANVSTTWNSHEPASILHHLVFLPDPYEPMQFLIDRGIDLTITDYRWNSTAAGWARHALRDEKMAQWLEEAQRRRSP
jgi:hypothetical protein